MEVEIGERVVLRGLGKANCYMMSLGKRMQDEGSRPTQSRLVATSPLPDPISPNPSTSSTSRFSKPKISILVRVAVAREGELDDDGPKTE